MTAEQLADEVIDFILAVLQNSEITPQARATVAALLGPHLRAERWEPMGTAPKDGREVLLRVKYRAGIPYGTLVGHWQPGGHCIQDHPPIEAGWYFWNGIMFDAASEPIEWRPLPCRPGYGGASMTCEDCGTSLSDGMCPNCHEELFIATFQGDDMEQPWSDEFRDKVEEQAVIVRESRRTRSEGTKP